MKVCCIAELLSSIFSSTFHKFFDLVFVEEEMVLPEFISELFHVTHEILIFPIKMNLLMVSPQSHWWRLVT